MHIEYRPIKFPEDESVHNHIIEWWYFNGHLQDTGGHEYAFMDCLFRADVEKVKIPFISKVPLKTIYFSHSLLSDINRNIFFHKISPLSIVSDDSFSRPSLYINYINLQFPSAC
jgi:predicted secreted hydrolase